jgi:GTP-binding protein HflX
VLEEIGAHENPSLLVLNKTDRAERLPDGLEGVAVSALTGAGLDALKRAIGDAFGVARPAMKVLLRAGDGRTRAWLYKAGAVMDETVHEDGSLELTVRADEQLAGQLARRQEVLLRHA